VLTARAKVDFMASDASRIVDVELNQNLRVNEVRDASGKPVPFDRDENTPLKLEVTLPNTVQAGAKVTLQFEYGGPLSPRITTPTENVRLAYIDKDGGYLLLPSRWFPLTDFPTIRYTQNDCCRSATREFALGRADVHFGCSPASIDGK
jgi:hypothetical protein